MTMSIILKCQTSCESIRKIYKWTNNLHRRKFILKKMNDLRVKRTRQSLHTALRELMEEKPYEKIKVCEITERAMVARQTFYLHYEYKDQLLIDTCGAFMSGLRTELEKTRSDPGYQRGMGSETLVLYAKKNFESLRLLLDADVGHLVEEQLALTVGEIYYETLNERLESSHLFGTYLVHFIGAGTFRVLSHWIMDDMSTPAESLIELLAEITTLLMDLFPGRSLSKSMRDMSI